MRIIAATAAAIGLCSAALAQGSGERLVHAGLPGFVIGHTAEQGFMFIEEQVPSGETVQQWTRMVTKQRFAGLSGKIAPEDFLQRLTEGLTGACPGAVAGSIRTLDAAGSKAAELRADCPNNPATGKPETLFARAVAGPSDLHVLQVAFRSVPTETDAIWAQSHLKTAALCATGSTDTRCTSR